MSVSKDPWYYSREIKVPYPECDIHSEWKLSNIMRAIQQVASEQLDELGMEFKKLYSEGLVFLLSKELILMNRGIEAGEKVKITTWPVQPKGAQFRRNVFIEDAGGRSLVKAYTAWLLVNPRNHKILRPSAFPYQLHCPKRSEQADQNEQAIASMRISGAEAMVDGASLEVTYSNTDCNGHLNNAVYGDFVLDCLPHQIWEKMRPSSFFIHYIKEAKIGAHLSASLAQTEIGEWIFIGEVQSKCGEPSASSSYTCFEAELKLSHRQTD